MPERKLRLDAERLRVESFATHAPVRHLAAAAASVYTGAAPCAPTGWIGDCSRFCQ